MNHAPREPANAPASTAEKGDASKPATDGDKPSADKQPFVDRQLQKALDYLTTELAKAK